MAEKIKILFNELGFVETHGGVSRLFTEAMRNLPPEKITVVYLGYSMKPGAGGAAVDVAGRWGLEEGRYVLYVGKRGGHKNFNWMVGALAPVMKAGMKLFCAGAPC